MTMKASTAQPRFRLAAATAVAALLAPCAATAGPIALTSPDGIISLSGEFVAVEDGHFVVETGLGQLRVASDRVACEGSACPMLDPADADVRLIGSQAIALGLMPLLLDGYAAHLDAAVTLNDTGIDGRITGDLVAAGGFGDAIGRFLVEPTNSLDAFAALGDGRADLAMSSRRILPDEARALRNGGAGEMANPGQEHILAIDSLAVITHPENPVRDITMTELADVFAGRITNWSALGGPDAPIAIIDRDAESGTRATFYRAIFGATVPQTGTDGRAIADNGDETARMVMKDPNAIGFVGMPFQRDTKALRIVNACGMVTEPDAFAAKLEEYPLQRRLYLYNRGEELAPEARDFLDYATSEHADDVIAKSGFIDLGIMRKSQDLNGPRARMLLDPEVDAFEGGVMREMLAEMVAYDRLSTTFRFRTGSSRLDERGAIDMPRLINYLEGMPEGTRVLFVGFTDDVGGFANNRRLSIARAQKVAADIGALAGDRLSGIRIAATGFGEIAPSTCNTTEVGRAVNRRVEVWIDVDRQG